MASFAPRLRALLLFQKGQKILDVTKVLRDKYHPGLTLNEIHKMYFVAKGKRFNLAKFEGASKEELIAGAKKLKEIERANRKRVPDAFKKARKEYLKTRLADFVNNTGFRLKILNDYMGKWKFHRERIVSAMKKFEIQTEGWDRISVPGKFATPPERERRAQVLNNSLRQMTNQELEALSLFLEIPFSGIALARIPFFLGIRSQEVSKLIRSGLEKLSKNGQLRNLA